MILRNTVLNLTGFVVPLVISLAVIPGLVTGYGIERFGVITILWALVGYFGIFDLGIGKALTYAVAQIRDPPHRSAVIALTAQATGLLTIVGAAAGLAWLALSPTLGEAVSKGSDLALRNEVVLAFGVAAFALPLVLIAAAMRGVLEAYQAFVEVSLLRMLSGTLLFVAPAICLFIGKGLAGVAVSLIIARIITVTLSLGFCARLLGTMWLISWPRWAMIKPLLTIGGWMTISNLISPLTAYADRLMLGLAAGAAATAYYSTTNELVTKLWLLTGALTAVLFPEFARLRLCPLERVGALCNKAQKLIFACVFPVVLLVTVFSRELLSVWIGAEFAESAAPVLQVLGASMLISTMAQVPYSLVQASGRADLTAWMCLLLVLPYLIAIYYAALVYGPIGVAWVWFARIGVEYTVSTVFVRTVRPGIPVPWFTARNGTVLITGSLLLGVISWGDDVVLKLTGYFGVLCFMIVTYWNAVLDEKERQTMRDGMRRLRWNQKL